MGRCLGCLIPGLKKASDVKSKQGECAVCVGIDNDRSIREVFYCYLCDAWMCKKCEPKLFRRGYAAVKELFRFG